MKNRDPEPTDARRTALALMALGYRDPNPRNAEDYFHAAMLWFRVARIQRRLGHPMSTTDWLRVPAHFPR